MQREIKFRAFGKSGRMIPWSELRVLHANTFITNMEGFHLMQFTGLKDKNGKEIYEGDILPCVYAFDGCTEHVMVVEWNEDRAGFFPRWDYKKCHQKGVTKSMLDCTRLEVIGNIHEHPHLLNEKV